MSASSKPSGTVTTGFRTLPDDPRWDLQPLYRIVEVTRDGDGRIRQEGRVWHNDLDHVRRFGRAVASNTASHRVMITDAQGDLVEEVPVLRGDAREATWTTWGGVALPPAPPRKPRPRPTEPRPLPQLAASPAEAQGAGLPRAALPVVAQPIDAPAAAQGAQDRADTTPAAPVASVAPPVGASSPTPAGRPAPSDAPATVPPASALRSKVPGGRPSTPSPGTVPPSGPAPAADAATAEAVARAAALWSTSTSNAHATLPPSARVPSLADGPAPAEAPPVDPTDSPLADFGLLSPIPDDASTLP